MKNERIYLSPPHLSGEEIQRVSEVFQQNWVAPVGPDLEAWEGEISQYLNVNSCCLLNAGTAAIHLALRVLQIGGGDFVFVQSHNHIGCVNPILYQNATPIFIGSEDETWNMSPVFLEEAIVAISKKYGTEKCKAILPVHLYGMPAKMAEILKIGRKYGIPIIEDAAESLGSQINGRQTGSFGEMGILSFNGNKIITCGGGGALVSNDLEKTHRAKHLAAQARQPVAHYEHSEMGHNYRLSNVLAAIGRAQMTVLSDRINIRRANFKKYRTYFQKWNGDGEEIYFQNEPKGFFSNRWLTSIILKNNGNQRVSPKKIRENLAARNIESRPLWKPMHRQPLFENGVYFGNGFEETLFKNGLCLPSGSSLSQRDFQRIFTVLDSAFRL